MGYSLSDLAGEAGMDASRLNILLVSMLLYVALGIGFGLPCTFIHSFLLGVDTI